MQKERRAMNIEDAATEVLVNQLEIAKQSIGDRDQRIWELQKKVEAPGRHAEQAGPPNEALSPGAAAAIGA